LAQFYGKVKEDGTVARLSLSVRGNVRLEIFLGKLASTTQRNCRATNGGIRESGDAHRKSRMGTDVFPPRKKRFSWRV